MTLTRAHGTIPFQRRGQGIESPPGYRPRRPRFHARSPVFGSRTGESSWVLRVLVHCKEAPYLTTVLTQVREVDLQELPKRLASMRVLGTAGLRKIVVGQR